MVNKIFQSNKKDALWSLEATASPFDLTSEESSTEEDILAPDEGSGKSDEDTDDDERSTVLDSENGLIQDKGLAESAKKIQAFSTLPVASNTCLAILRLVGKYLLMMKLLQPIAADVFVCTTQLIHYYLYTICTTFGLSGGVSNKLSVVLRNIEKTIIMEDTHHLAQPATAADYSISVTDVGSKTAKVYRAKASPIISDVPACSCEGVAARLVACESLLLLCRELSDLRHSVLPNLLPPSAAQNCDAFFADLEDVLPEVVPAVYSCVGASVVPQEQLVQQMSAVSWSINRLESQHNGYVDQIVRLMQGFSSVLQNVKSTQPLPASAEEHLWRTTVEQLHTALLHGYAAAKASSNEGRSLMQLDYQQLTSKLEPLCGLRPLPGRSLVEGYIKAFYLPESALRDWLLEHRTEYNTRHLVALVSVMSHIPKHARNSIVATLESRE
ncbi:Protein of unknown function DUF2451 C-terminal [Trinorchestia longiramus]|nr:Protein of unknown function DUF2451 C-terminal [Trinorchestia longiramus]